MSVVINYAVLGLAAASIVAADAPAPMADDHGCISLVEAVNANNLGRLEEAVLSVVGESSADALQVLATSTFELPEDSKVTIFAPVDEAWPAVEELPAGPQLVAILAGHVVETFLPAEAVVAAFADADEVPVPTLGDTEIKATTDGESIFVAAEGQDPGAMVLETDIMTCVGVIHTISALLLPTDGAMAPGPVALEPMVEAPVGAVPGDALAPIAAVPVGAEGPSPTLAPSVLSPPVVDPVTGAPTPDVAVGATDVADDDDVAGVAPAEAGEEGTRGLTPGGEVTGETAGASHMVVGAVASAAAVAFSLLA